MTRPLTCASDRVFGVRWWTMATVLLGLPVLNAIATGGEYRQPVYSANSSVYHSNGSHAATPGVPVASPVQQIPTYGGNGSASGTHQAAYSDTLAAGDQAALRAYRCSPAQGAVLNATLNQQFGALPAVRIAHDRASSQLLVMAPEAIQQKIASQINAAASVLAAAPPAVTAAPTVAANAPRPIHSQAITTAHVPPAAGMERREYQLKHVTAPRLASVLQGALGTRWSQVPQPAGAPATYRLAVVGHPGFTVRLDHKRNRLLLEGPSGTAYQSCARLIQSLDTPTSTEEHCRCLVSLTRLTTEDLTETVNAIHVSNGPVAPRRSAMGPEQVLLAQAQSPVQPAAVPEASDGDDEVTATIPLPGAKAGQGEGAGLIGSVQIEMLEDLNMIVIKGHKRDVQQVLELIQEIEDMSAETEPAVTVHHLVHVNCEALATLVSELYSEVFLPRQGDVSITALVKPNALLLIGRPESVETVVSLTKRLDRPVPPESQFKVFRLQHAAATTTQQTIDEFFQNSEGEPLAALGTRVHVIADVRSNSLIVRASPRDMREVGRMITEIDTREAAAVNDLRVFKLKNSLAEDLEPILQNAITGQTAGRNQQNAEEKSIGLRFVTIDPSGQKLLSSGILADVRVTADPRANALLISAPAESMPLIEALVNQLDQLPAAEAQVKVFTIINGDASGLVEMLEMLFGETNTNQSDPPVRTGASEGDSSLVSLRFATDVRTNSIIATGSTGDLAVVEAILLRLDDSEVRERKSTVYRLKNAPAEDVATAINELLAGEQDVRLIQEGLFSSFEIFEREVIVVAEPVSNSLIVSATSKYYNEIADIVEQLDERPPMVMIQVLIAEVRLNDTEEFGIELGLQDSILFDRSLLGEIETISQTSQTTGLTQVVTENIVSATNEPGFLFNDVVSPLGNSGAAGATTGAGIIGGQGISNFAVGRLNSELGFGGLVLSASSESVSMLLRALKEDRRIDVLSRPQIMTLDNQPASIQVGERVPTVTGTETNDSGGLTNSVDFQDVGLIVGVTPRISPDGLVVMEIDAEKSEVGPEAEGIPISVSEGVTIRSPRIKTITATTTVSALDGQTVVLGGLITTNKLEVDRRVPWLSKIPVLGHLFRYQGFDCERSELLIVMTPRIVNSEEDAELIKQAEAARMSWCLNDVLQLHEDVAFRPRGGHWGDDETNTIYPDGDSTLDGFESLKYQPLDPSAEPGEAPLPAPAPSEEARRNPARLQQTPAGVSNHVSPASYEAGAAPGTSSSSGVYPAMGTYGTSAPLYPANASYPSTASY